MSSTQTNPLDRTDDELLLRAANQLGADTSAETIQRALLLVDELEDPAAVLAAAGHLDADAPEVDPGCM